jgi:hypothetical protein
MHNGLGHYDAVLATQQTCEYEGPRAVRLGAREFIEASAQKPGQDETLSSVTTLM